MKVNRIDHICIAVKSLEQGRKVWEPILGKTQPDETYLDELEGLLVHRYWLGNVGFEIMESTTSGSEVEKFIERNGEGIMLIALNVDKTAECLNELKASGNYQMIDEPKPFREKYEYCFIHPRSVNGVLLELIDYDWPEFGGRDGMPATD
jgi:methylmalonyl-CoA/ethylmalonyl-CoA epimerase